MFEQSAAALEKEGLSVSNVVCWTGRPQRTRRAPRTYWDEHVVTDDWYTTSLVEDVPLEEMDAACIDEDFSSDSESSAPPLEDESDDESFISDDGVESDSVFEPTDISSDDSMSDEQPSSDTAESSAE